MLADLAIFLGLGAMIAGVWGAWGWPYAAMLGGFVLFVAGGQAQKMALRREVERRVREAEQ